jgi:predicted dehydrogenase
VAVVDANAERARQVAEEYSVSGYTDVDVMLKELGDTVDLAVIAVPHNEYLPIIRRLAEYKIDIIKEKPFATSIEEANELKQITAATNILIYVTLQRRINPIFLSFKQLMKRIGRVYSIEGRYTLNIGHLGRRLARQQTNRWRWCAYRYGLPHCRPDRLVFRPARLPDMPTFQRQSGKVSPALASTTSGSLRSGASARR